MLPSLHTGKGLIRQFAILGFLVIGLVTLVLSLVISHYLQRDLLEREWVTTADYVRTQILSHLTPGDLASPEGGAAQGHFETLYQRIVSMPEIFRVKIYDTGMTVVWSDEPRLIGQRFSDNAHLEGALAGRTVVNLESRGGKEENISERNVFARVVEVYVPIVFPGASRVAGAVEVYKMRQQVFASIRKGQLTVVGTVLACGLLLYLSLFWIVRRAARHLEEQHQTLETQEPSRSSPAACREMRGHRRCLQRSGTPASGFRPRRSRRSSNRSTPARPREPAWDWPSPESSPRPRAAASRC
jgi:two-component system, NtrC family, sensor histidine kinase HydH